MYIRTKNRIYEVESVLRDNGFVKGYNVGEMAFIRKDQVIKQSDTIEELCDRYVGISNNKPMIIKYEFDEYYDEYGDSYTKEELLMEYDIIYGCIWVEIKLSNNKSVFRLEPVAIMNENGDLEFVET